MTLKKEVNVVPKKVVPEENGQATVNVAAHPGELFPDEKGPGVSLNAGRRTVKLTVHNTGDRAVQVGSHFHFFEANRALEFDRVQAFGMRLDIPAGTAIRLEPGTEHEVTLVPFAGSRRVFGFAGLVNGSLDQPGKLEEAMELAWAFGYRGVSEELAKNAPARLARTVGHAPAPGRTR